MIRQTAPDLNEKEPKQSRACSPVAFLFHVELCKHPFAISLDPLNGRLGYRQDCPKLCGIKCRTFQEEIDRMSLLLEKIFLERQDKTFGGILIPESVNGSRRDEDQRVGLDRKVIEIDVEGRGSACHPKDLIKVVSVRTLPILAEPEPFLKKPDVKLILSPGCVIGKWKDCRLWLFRVGIYLR